MRAPRWPRPLASRRWAFPAPTPPAATSGVSALHVVLVTTTSAKPARPRNCRARFAGTKRAIAATVTIASDAANASSLRPTAGATKTSSHPAPLAVPYPAVVAVGTTVTGIVPIIASANFPTYVTRNGIGRVRRNGTSVAR